jgi:hypothetical protein
MSHDTIWDKKNMGYGTGHPTTVDKKVNGQYDISLKIEGVDRI